MDGPRDGQRKLAEIFKKAREERKETVPEVVRHPMIPPQKLRAEQAVNQKPSRDHTRKFHKATCDSKRIQKKQFKMRLAHKKDPRNSRTLFIGNLPANTNRKDVLKLVMPYGKVESLRQRSTVITPGKLPVHIARKLGKQQGGSSINYYVVMATDEIASACLELNGIEVSGRHIRVDLATPTKDTQHTVFVGNLPFDIDEEEVRQAFHKCGEVDSVRIIKDNRTGIGKGFAYVKFKDRSGVLFGCKQNGKIELKGRKLRVFRCYNKLKYQTKFGAMKSQPGVKCIKPNIDKKKRSQKAVKKKKIVDKAKRDKRKREKDCRKRKHCK